MDLSSLFKIVHNRNSLPEKSKSGHDFVEDAKKEAAGKVQWGRDVLRARRQHSGTRNVAHSKRQVANSKSSKEHATEAEQQATRKRAALEARARGRPAEA